MKKQFSLLTLLLLFTIGIGQMWGAVYKTYSLSDLSNSGLTYEVTGLSGNDQKLNKGERKVEVPCASASGTLYLSGTSSNSGRYASIYKSNGTTYDADRQINMTNGYNSTGISFTSADILTDGDKYYIVFGSSADYKINKFKYTLSQACSSGGGDPTPAADTYTVKYKDGTTELYSESIEVGSHPAGITDPKKDCYEFAGWKDGTADVADVTALSGEKDEVITLQAQWTPLYVPQGSDYVFVNNAEVGTAPNKLTMTNGTTVNVTAGSRIDNIFFGAMAIKYESGATPSSGDDFKGWKINTNSATIKFLVENDSRVTITVGNLTSGCNIAYTNTSNTAQNVALAAKTANGYDVKGGTMVTLTTQGNKTVTLKGIAVSEVPALSDIATLSDLKVNGTTVAGFASGTQIYRTSVAYGTAIADMPKITGATATDANATVSDVQETFYDSDHGYYVSQVKVTAQNGTDYKFYQLRITVEPKLGVELIKALTSTDLTDGVGTATGYIGGKYYTNNGKGATKKLDSGKNYGLELKGDNTFNEGDLFVMNITTAAGATMGTMKLYESAEATDNLYESTNIGTTGLNGWALTDAVDAKNALFIKRGSGNDWNPTFSSIAVYRYMAPFIESFEIAGIGALTINGTNITAEVANDFDVTALTPTIKYWANGEAQIDKTGAQDFTNPVTYTVSSQYAEDATGAYAPVTYTVTITKVVPSATPSITTQPQGANYYEGATIAALSVVAEAEDNGTLTYQWYLGADAIDGATEATYQPTVSEIGSYSYTCVVTNKKDDKPAASVTSNAAVIAIEDDPNAIKLLNGSTVNTAKFITGVAASKVTIGTTEYDCVTFAGTVGSSVASSNMKLLDRHVTYNATTDKTKIKLSLYNANTSNKRTIYVQGVIEGNTNTEDIVNLATIELAKGEQKTTEYIEFNNAKNRSIYIFVSSNAGDIKILQEKIIESGTALKKAGESGYSLNMNKGRIFGAKEATLAFEGLSYTLAGDYTPVSSTALKVKSSNIVFTVNYPTLLKVTTANNKTYYVTKGAAGTDNETAKTGVSEFDLTEGTWYITAATSEVQFTNIAFEAPKCAEPQFNALQNSDICAGDPYVALDGTATVADAGTPIYQWYKAEGDVEIEGATNETYTPTADGSYYVIATNQLAGCTDNVKKSATVTVTTYASAAITTAPESQRKVAGQNATLSVVASGKAPLSYQWYTCDENGDNAVAIENAEAASYVVAVTAGLHQYYKVIVTSGCGSAEAIALVQEWVDYEQVDVTGSMTWNFTTANLGLEADVEATSTKILANVGQGAIPNNANFHSDMLVAMVEATQTKVRATENGGCYQGDGIKFHTTVPGVVTVTYRGTGNSASVTLTIGTTTLEPYAGGFTTSKVVYVPAGDVEITSVGTMRIKEIVFDADPDYDRTVNPSLLGTLCWKNNAVLGGATLYEFAGKNEYNYLVFDEVPGNALEAGKPYIFMPENGNTKIQVYNTDKEAALTEDQDPVNNMYGTITGKTLVPGEDDNMYYFSANHIWAVKDFTVNIDVPAYYCYIDYPAVLAAAPANAPANGRRRVTMGVKGEQVATGFENLNASEKPMKLMINGQIYILRGEKMYDVTGKVVK